MFGTTFNLFTLVGLPQFLEHILKMIALDYQFSIKQLFQSQKPVQNRVNALSKKVNHFLSKVPNFIVWTIQFCSKSPTCGPNTYNRIMYGEILDFQCQNPSNGYQKCSIGKSFFAVNLRLELFHATVANAELETVSIYIPLKNIHLYHMQMKFEKISCSKQLTKLQYHAPINTKDKHLNTFYMIQCSVLPNYTCMQVCVRGWNLMKCCLQINFHHVFPIENFYSVNLYALMSCLVKNILHNFNISI